MRFCFEELKTTKRVQYNINKRAENLHKITIKETKGNWVSVGVSTECVKLECEGCHAIDKNGCRLQI